MAALEAFPCKIRDLVLLKAVFSHNADCFEVELRGKIIVGELFKELAFGERSPFLGFENIGGDVLNRQSGEPFGRAPELFRSLTGQSYH